MPEHISKEYIKDNSHISWIQDQERNNPNIHRYTEMMFYDYYDYFDTERRAIPIALILYSEEEEKKFIYYWNLRETCPRNSFPVYILVHMQEVDDYRFIARFGLMRLGKFGSNLDSKKCISLRVMQNGNSGMVRRNDIDIYYKGRPVISIHDSSNSDCLSLFVCDCYQIVKLTVNLCQEDVENTFIHAEFSNNPIISNNMPHRYGFDPSYESTMISPNIYTNGCQTNILHHTGYVYPVGNTSTICLFQYENGVQKLIENIEVKDSISGNSVSLVNQSNDEIFIMNYGGRKHGFYKVTPSRRMDDSIISPEIEKVSFENYAQFKPYDDERRAIIPCPLTNTKYLILITNIEWQRTSYQRVFTKSTWLLVDLNETRVKVVYPRVYDLANLTKQSDDDDFVTVKKKFRGGRSGKIGQFQDGDLNGGYSDPALLSAIKPSNIHSSDLKDFTDSSSSCDSEVISDQKPVSLIPFPEKYNLSDAKLTSFRPFTENPELFQVHLFCPECVETLVKYLVPKIKKVDSSYGQSFRFYFKFRDEATCKYYRLLIMSKEGQFSDISIKTH